MDCHNIIESLQKARWKFLVGFWLLTIVFVALVYFKPPIAQSLRHEAPLWTFATALQFNLAGAMAVFAGFMTRFAGIRRPRAWVLWGMGFMMICLGADEMLTLHERVGRHIQTSSIVQSVSLGGYGDNVVILCYGLVGLIITLLALKDLLADRYALKFYAAAVLFGCYSVVSDYLPRRYLSAHMPLLTEEIMEMLFAVALMSAFFCHIITAATTIMKNVSLPNSATNPRIHDGS